MRRLQARFRRINGFTAIELTTVLAIVAILAAIAAPSMRDMVITQRMRSVSSALSESLWLARSEAIKRNTPVAFRFNAGTTAASVDGWTIATGADASGTELQRQDGFPSVQAKSTSAGGILFTFNAFGRLTSGSSTAIELSAPTSSVKRWICISASGRPKFQENACA